MRRSFAESGTGEIIRPGALMRKTDMFTDGCAYGGWSVVSGQHLLCRTQIRLSLFTECQREVRVRPHCVQRQGARKQPPYALWKAPCPASTRLGGELEGDKACRNPR